MNDSGLIVLMLLVIMLHSCNVSTNTERLNDKVDTLIEEVKKK